jgi:addiction module HigA family antidote
MTMSMKRHPPIHPGEILREEFLKPAGVSQWRVAVECHVPPRRINEIALGKRAITADTALRLGRYFGVSPQFWLNLQAAYDLEVAATPRLVQILDRIQALALNAAANALRANRAQHRDRPRQALEPAGAAAPTKGARR